MAVCSAIFRHIGWTLICAIGLCFVAAILVLFSLPIAHVLLTVHAPPKRPEL